jgi:hypothetical protein
MWLASTGKPLTEGTEPIELETFLRLHLTGITSDLHDVVWYYNKKSGVIQEHGEAGVWRCFRTCVHA